MNVVLVANTAVALLFPACRTTRNHAVGHRFLMRMPHAWLIVRLLILVLHCCFLLAGQRLRHVAC
jgi:hypothetical protein